MKSKMKWIVIVFVTLLLTGVNGLPGLVNDLLNLLPRNRVCCPEVNMCFSKAPPYDGLPLPWCPNLLSIEMKLYTQRNPNTGEKITADSIPLNFNGDAKTIYIVLGFLETESIALWMQNMKNSLLEQGDYNVITVDWKGGSMNPNYAQAASNTRTAGAMVAYVSNYTIKKLGSSRSRQHCIGASLGAHVCGHAGKYGQFARISGLDAAGPLFEDRDKSAGLNPSCADFVDVMHTNGCPLTSGCLGTVRPLGHVDFYPNGGRFQPGCVAGSPDFTALDFYNSPAESIIDLIPTCSHSRAPLYYNESIEKLCFLTNYICTDHENLPNSCEEKDKPVQSMGFYVDKYPKSGIFYVKTNNKPPFCISK